MVIKQLKWTAGGGEKSVCGENDQEEKEIGWMIVRVKKKE